MRILIAEDDKVTRLVLRRILEGIGGLEIQEVEDGQKAWDLLDGGLVPNLCFFDINMPRLNGMDLLKKLRNDKRFAQLKVCFCSAIRERQTIVQAAALQPDYYILKPLSVSVVREQVLKAKAALNPNASYEPADLVCARLGVDKDTYVEMLDSLKQQVASLTTRVPNLLMQMDVSGALDVLNEARIAAQSLGAHRLMGLTENLSRSFKANQGLLSAKSELREEMAANVQQWIARSSDQLLQAMQEMRAEVEQIERLVVAIAETRAEAAAATEAAQSRNRQQDVIGARLVEAFQRGKLAAPSQIRSKSLNVPIRAAVVGENSEQARGLVTRKTSFTLKILDDATTKGIENCRKINDVVRLLSYQVDGGRRWMPDGAIRLLEAEISARNAQGVMLLRQAIGSNLEVFLAKHEPIIRENLDLLCRESQPGARAPEERVQAVLEDMRQRFQPAFEGSITALPVFTNMDLASLTEEDEDGKWEPAYRLLEQAARLFRSAVVDSSFDRQFKFSTFDRQAFLEAMNVFSDPMLMAPLPEKAQADLDQLDRIAEAKDGWRKKTCQVWALVRGQGAEQGDPPAAQPVLQVVTTEQVAA
jgi:two-component system chemotaxis response regulator CheY